MNPTLCNEDFDATPSADQKPHQILEAEHTTHLCSCPLALLVKTSLSKEVLVSLTQYV